MNIYNKLEGFFVNPEKLPGSYNFADIPEKISFHDANVIFYGVPLDLTTSFGKGTSFGPDSMRMTSARQIETFLLYEKIELYKKARIFDIGNLKIDVLNRDDKTVKQKYLDKIDESIVQITKLIRSADKLPVLIGGEHTLSYFSIKGLSENKDLVVLHFDAHRDMKPSYEGIKICHTTPFFHLINEGIIDGKNLIQIGIRQCDEFEDNYASMAGVRTFDGWSVNADISSLLKYISEITDGKKLYISFDIDVYDIPYVPCTGTPEPYGLDPFQIIKIINSISVNSTLVGIDMVEVSLKNNDYREAALATETLYRILARLKL